MKDEDGKGGIGPRAAAFRRAAARERALWRSRTCYLCGALVPLGEERDPPLRIGGHTYILHDRGRCQPHPVKYPTPRPASERIAKAMGTMVTLAVLMIVVTLAIRGCTGG